jgi:hypothetical protein
MDAMSSSLPWILAIAAGLALVAAVFSLWQSLRGALGGAMEAPVASTPELTSDARATLLERKNAMLRNLKDLHFERDVGKISEADFVKLDALYRQKAREVLAELDAEVGPWRDEAEKLVKSAVAKVKKEEPKPEPEPSPSPSPSPSPLRAEHLECPKCEVINDPDATFCKKCAARLVEAEPAAAPAEEKQA